MWYVRDEYSSKIYFKDKEVINTQAFATRYNKTFKFCGQRIFKFVINDFVGLVLFPESRIDVNGFTCVFNLFGGHFEYKHCFAVCDFNKKHLKYLKNKSKLIRKLSKKYHLWSYNDRGRKCDGFDF